ncbi:hypothetical protein BL254_20800 [Protofrankia sp. BMG5.30]|nr:hypothetical protein BL254_20800 [Protofrankia sp. BMG5.30]
MWWRVGAIRRAADAAVEAGASWCHRMVPPAGPSVLAAGRHGSFSITAKTLFIRPGTGCVIPAFQAGGPGPPDAGTATADKAAAAGRPAGELFRMAFPGLSPYRVADLGPDFPDRLPHALDLLVRAAADRTGK